MDELDKKYRALKQILKDMDLVLIAFSGGVDSTLLLKVARTVLGDRVLAVTARSATTSSREREDAELLARQMEVEHLQVETHELEMEDFIRNPADKCYTCKKHRFGGLVELARSRNIPYVLDGENTDDRGDFRPGERAARELGVRSPLREAGLSKQEVRALSKQLDLPTWNKPALACLASRIPYGMTITVDKLRQVDAGEQFLVDLGFTSQVRVRHYGDTARIEVETEQLPKIIEPEVRDSILKFFKDLGFSYVTLNLEGYRMGSLNLALAPVKEG